MREVFVPRSAEVYPVFPDLFFPVAPVPIAPTASFEKLWGLFFLRNFWFGQLSENCLRVSFRGGTEAIFFLVPSGKSSRSGLKREGSERLAGRSERKRW